jgi:RNA polymerase sigma factor (TIGR02999 family)
MHGLSHGPSQIEVTRLLKAWGAGDDKALEQLAAVVESELDRLAHGCMTREKPGHTLQTTALVNEVYLRLLDISAVDWTDRAHFFAISARMMRPILTDFARSRNYQKRGAGAVQVSLDEALVVTPEEHADIMALDEALTEVCPGPSPAESGGGTALLWWIGSERSGGGSENISRDCQA